MARVELDKVTKVYDNGQVAVAEASFEVADAELVVLVGPSGCGKSTLLRMVAGLEAISSGTLKIGDRIVNDVAPKERDIAMVFQSYALYPHMSVAENLSFGLRLRGESREVIDARVLEAASLLGLEKLLERRPRQLSGGQRQRVALGRALVRKPQVFLLDEPLSNLDAKLRLTMRTEIARLHRLLKTTMLYVTHDQIEAMTLGHRIVVLNGGVIQQIDAPMRIYDRPDNVFVATFLGSPAMNLFRGRIAVDPAPRLVGEGLEFPLGELPAGLNAQALRNTEVVVGLRPEHLQVAAQDGAARLCRLEGRIEVIEPIGNEIFVTVRRDQSEVTARVAPQGLPEVGQPLVLQYSPTKLHFFEAASGNRLQESQPAPRA